MDKYLTAWRRKGWVAECTTSFECQPGPPSHRTKSNSMILQAWANMSKEKRLALKILNEVPLLHPIAAINQRFQAVNRSTGQGLAEWTCPVASSAESRWIRTASQRMGHWGDVQLRFRPSCDWKNGVSKTDQCQHPPWKTQNLWSHHDLRPPTFRPVTDRPRLFNCSCQWRCARCQGNWIWFDHGVQGMFPFINQSFRFEKTTWTQRSIQPEFTLNPAHCCQQLQNGRHFKPQLCNEKYPTLRSFTVREL